MLMQLPGGGGKKIKTLQFLLDLQKSGNFFLHFSGQSFVNIYNLKIQHQINC